MTYRVDIKLYKIIGLVMLKTRGKKRQKHSPNVVFVDDVDKCVIRNTKSRNYMEEMPVEEKKSGRKSRHCYLEVKVPEGSTGVSG